MSAREIADAAIRSLDRVAVALVLLVLTLGVALGFGPMKQRVAEVRSDPIVVDFEWPAMAGQAGQTWMPASERARLKQIVTASLALNPLDGSSLADAQRALRETGWFKDRGPRIRRAPGGQAHVTGQWRLPRAAVRHEGVDYVVSGEAILLPLSYQAGGAGDLPVVTGAWAGPPPSPGGGSGHGEYWQGVDVQHALKLIDYLRRSQTVREHLAGVDVSEFGEDRHLTIVTTEGGRLIWGGVPGESHPGEQSDAEKLRRFETLVTDPGWRDARRATLLLYTPKVYYDATATGG